MLLEILIFLYFT